VRPEQRQDELAIDAALVERWLVGFLRDELVRRRSVSKAVVGVSGGVDSAVVAFLCARALGSENVLGVRMPYATSSAESARHGKLLIAKTKIIERVIDISAAVDGYLRHETDASPQRRGNVMARMRMIVLFDQSAKIGGLPIGTGNKSERMFGYFTWHGDDSPPINPIGDLFKTQVWALARHLGVPREIIEKPATADLIRGQTDEEDLGITYERADRILHRILMGYTAEDIVAQGFKASDVALVKRRVDATHWKRHLATTAMTSETAINEFYLRPVDY
jgi:NAD+ synthase